MGRGPTPLSTAWGLIKRLSRPRGKLWSSLPHRYNLSHSKLTFINVFAPGRGRRPTAVAMPLLMFFLLFCRVRVLFCYAW